MRFQCEWHDETGQWWRSQGNELWEFDADGLMSCREAGVDDVPVTETTRTVFGPREDDGR
ncbi:DUF1348 family protein [Streptosporangium sp. CA-135522]|uniref:DUF1348 family protein n=1 Tax=Streptosporangium sp. CA-135522 TaxID=3240072 RepID=UPI003D900EC7